MAISQEDYMHAIVGDDNKMWKPIRGFFTPGTPLYNEEGGDILKGPRKMDAAKRLLTDSGYVGQPITCLVAQDVTSYKIWGEVTADLLKHLGMKLDMVETDSGTMVARRTQKSPPGQGGWHMYHATHPGVDCTNPATNKPVRANGDAAMFGWPNIPAVEAEIAAWFDAKTFDEEKAAALRLNKAALDHVVYAPVGFYLSHQAWHKTVAGIVKGPAPFFWGVSKAA
jgi:peptide/nickel transport system substrate-binding protein